MFSSVLTISFLSALGSVVALGPAAVNLRTAANFAILAETGVSTVPPSVITGNVAVSPIAATGLTGFSLTVDSTGQFSTSSQVVGKLFAASYSAPTPATLTTAIGDMGTAFTDATGRVNPNFSNLASGAIGGLILPPGLYKWTSAVSIGSDITLAGGATDTWIFQVTGTLSIAAGKKMVLVGGALPSNIVWVVTGAVTAGAGSHLEGVILGKTSITLQTGTTANSRLLAQTSVALQQV
ncbi:antifreeze protein [Mycena epipterygia]|nr:antifreeze protein [Mycena epipterygia]